MTDSENPQPPSKSLTKNESKGKCPSTKKTKSPIIISKKSQSPASIKADTPPKKAKSSKSPAKTKESTQNLSKVSASSKKNTSSQRKNQVKSVKNSTKTVSKTQSTKYSLAYHVKKFATTHFIIFRNFWSLLFGFTQFQRFEFRKYIFTQIPANTSPKNLHFGTLENRTGKDRRTKIRQKICSKKWNRITLKNKKMLINWLIDWL